jgi:ribonuclease HII
VVSIKSSKTGRLSRIGVRDSKLLTRRKREFLYDEIYSLAEDVKTSSIIPEEINSAMSSGISLNELEAIHIARLIDSLDNVRTVFIDSPDVIPERFGVRISVLSNKPMRVKGVKKAPRQLQAIRVISEHKADSRYPVVSAASIIAKVTRDRELDSIAATLGIELGSGYPSDKATTDMLRETLNEKRLLPYIREHWKTIKRIRQLRMAEFLGANK